MQTKGVFLTFEGGDGAGKTSLIKALAKTLEEKGYTVVLTREPGGSLLSEEVRELLLKKRKEELSWKAELLLFLGARAQHIFNTIAPALEKGAIVLCDRFTDSTLAYQGAARGLGMEEIGYLCSWTEGGLSPSRTLLLDIDPKEGLKRSRKVSVEDRMEEAGLEFHQNVRKAFLSLAEKNKERITVLNASKSQEEVFSEAWEDIKNLFEDLHG